MSEEEQELEISVDNLIDPQQIGWIGYREGDAIVRVKVIRGDKLHPFLSHVTGFAKGVKVHTVSYLDTDKWHEKAYQLLRAFRKSVGDAYYFSRKATTKKDCPVGEI